MYSINALHPSYDINNINIQGGFEGLPYCLSLMISFEGSITVLTNSNGFQDT